MNPGRRPPAKDAVAAGVLLSQLLTRWGMDRKLREYQAWEVWDEVVGPQIAARARPCKMREGVLEVAVDQPVWMQQLQLMKPRIVSQLNARLGEALIRDIFWRRGRRESATAGGPLHRTPGPNRNLPPLDDGDLADIEKVLSPLADPAVKESLRAVLCRQARLTKNRTSHFRGNQENPAPGSGAD
jgi:hypothetical protein